MVGIELGTARPAGDGSAGAGRLRAEPYRGRDRRSGRTPADFSGQDRRGSRSPSGEFDVLDWLRGAAFPWALAAAAAAVAELIRTALPSTAQLTLVTLLATTRTGVLFAAGVLCVLQGRWSGRAYVLQVGAGLLVLAFAVVGNGSPLSSAPVEVAGELAVAFFCAAVTTPDVRSGLSMGKLLTLSGGCLLAVAIAAVAINGEMSEGLSADSALIRLPLLLVSALWLGIAVAHRRASRQGIEWLWRACLLFSAADVIRAVPALGNYEAAQIALAIDCAGGLLAVAEAAVLVRRTLEQTSGTASALARQLTRERRQQERQVRNDDERLHEVRTVLAGLKIATGSLRKYEDRIDPGIRRRLERAVGAELERLQHLIDPGDASAMRHCDLGVAVAGVLETQRASGLAVTGDLLGAVAWARPQDVAAVISNLLVNARTHAPGANVSLSWRSDGKRITVVIADDGPGIPTREREAVFARGCRGAATLVAGSGLGLFTARRLAREMGGALRLDCPDDEAGTRFELTMLTSAQSFDDVDQILDASQLEGPLAGGSDDPPRARPLLGQHHDRVGDVAATATADDGHIVALSARDAGSEIGAVLGTQHPAERVFEQPGMDIYAADHWGLIPCP